jgi:hypothetical protein
MLDVSATHTALIESTALIVFKCVALIEEGRMEERMKGQEDYFVGLCQRERLRRYELEQGQRDWIRQTWRAINREHDQEDKEIDRRLTEVLRIWPTVVKRQKKAEREEIGRACVAAYENLLGCQTELRKKIKADKDEFMVTIKMERREETESRKE